MRIPIYRRDPKSRVLFVIANLALAVGLILWAFVRPALAASHAWLDAVCGLLMGFYVTVNLMLMRGAGRCEGPQGQP